MSLSASATISPDGNFWCVRFWVDQIQADGTTKRVKGQRVQLCSAKASKRTAQELQRLAAEEHNSSPYLSAKMTVREFVGGANDGKGNRWGIFIPEYVLGRGLARKTEMEYLEVLRNHIVVILGDVPISDVSYEQLAKLIQVRKAGKYATSTLSRIKKVMNLVIRHAIRRGFYTKSNPVDLLMLPKGQLKTITGYTWDQAIKTLDNLDEPTFTAAALSMLTTLRSAELAGIRVRRVNLTHEPIVDGNDVYPHMSIAVRENYVVGRYGDPKTGKSRRNVAIPDVLYDKIARLCVGKDPDAPLFAGRTGNPINTLNISKRTFRPLSEKLGFWVHWHGFRHTTATWTDEIGMRGRDRMDMMGHSSMAMTEHYTDLLEAQRRAQDAMARRLFAVKETEAVN
jgi:integrase